LRLRLQIKKVSWKKVKIQYYSTAIKSMIFYILNIKNMDLKAKLKESLQSASTWEVLWQQMEINVNNEVVQSIIQRAFLWLGIITFIVFAVGYYMVSLIKAWTITPTQYMIAFWASAILWLVLVFVISWFWQKFNYATLAILTILFAVLEWVWLSWVLAAYSSASVINAFAWASVLFIVMALYGYFTKTDLTKLWTLLLVGLIAIIILTIINISFIHSSWFDLILSILWLIIFLWLTAWDLQILKQMAATWDKRLELVFGVSLFLDFINIFLELLRIFGDRDS